jgi:iron complex outermembrane receptor protein
MSLRDFRPRPIGFWSVVVLIWFLAAALTAQGEPGQAELDERTTPGVEVPEAEQDEGLENEIVEDETDETDEINEIDEIDEIDEVAPGTEIINITANRRSENLQKAAISVTALRGSFIEDVGLTNFTDIQKFTPNLQIIPQGDSRSTSIRIRGIGSVGTNAGIDPSVGIFIDGVYQGRAGMSVQDLMDIQSIEILRGPQGTLYGKNTAAGALKIKSRTPDYETSVQAEYVTGDFATTESRLTGNFPLVEDFLATRITGYWVNRSGYERNAAPVHEDLDINETTRWGVRNSTLLDLTDDVRLLIRGDYAQVNENCCAADVWRYGRDGDVPFIPGAAEQLAFDAGVTLQPAVRGDRVVPADQVPRNNVQVGGVSGEIQAELWDHSFNFQIAARNYQTKSVLDADFSELDVVTTNLKENYDQISAEVRAVSPSFEYFDYVGGLYFFLSDHGTDDVLRIGSDHSFFADQVNTGFNDHRATSVAGFADSNLKISEFWGNSPKITLTGGFRLGWERKEHKGSQISRGPLGIFETPVSGPDAFSDQGKDDTYITGRAIIKWEPEFLLAWEIGDPMVYASLSTGYKSGGYNQLRATGAATEPEKLYFKPERSRSYELGMRTRWLDRMITLNLTGFFTDYKDFQAQVFDGFSIEVLNASSFQTYGFESDLTLALLEGWITVFGAGYTKTEYRNFPGGPQIQGSTAGGTQNLKGKRLDNTPLWNLSLFSSYERSVPDFLLGASSLEVNWFLIVDYNYQSARNLNASLDPFLRVAPTHTVGLRAGVRHPDTRWEVAFWIKNLTDEDVWAIGLDVPLIAGYAAFQLPPRTYGATIRVKF